ncbi:phage baseplate assembly protein V [Sporomusa acidovorans]|uniref:Phage-related baseplate assembly protein n=1 Tax=Sporomusa acidovorans (strain ATCC 49682 / DSM 3132 / Mol) TaxID=1123286 RepID=A0ABZ3J910_SPOA4|nr:phage baseplate assembly protein V [Sporomusa acidovorans]OZC16006.1 phage-related baseplate assembly protein [Sporomusa acidovorans DSM 3132]SDD89943.1 phage baseplate assembly protein V [Sporomusa acidovorans]
MDSVLKNLVRVGRVSSINPQSATVRVVFEDRQNMVSYDLPVIVRQSLKNKDYFMPDVGEQVVCLFLPNGNAQGFCLGSFYSSVDVPSVSDSNKRHIRFADGTSLEYDRETHTLTIQAQGPLNVMAGGNVNVTGDVIADGISLKTHVHGGVQSGGSTTGKPS